MVIKKEKEESMVSSAKIAIPAAGCPESSASPKGVIELSGDESKGLIASFAAIADTSPYDAGPSTPRVLAIPDTNND
jgi:hypothetical protein